MVPTREWVNHTLSVITIARSEDWVELTKYKVDNAI